MKQWLKIIISIFLPPTAFAAIFGLFWLMATYKWVSYFIIGLFILAVMFLMSARIYLYFDDKK